MKFMLMMNAPRQGWEGMATAFSAADFQAHVGFMKAFARKLTESGELVLAEGLDMPVNAVVVRAGPDGEAITDGPFAESKEFLAGFWIVDCESRERAYAIAAEASAAPGPGGRRMSIPIEVRQVMAGPPDPEA